MYTEKKLDNLEKLLEALNQAIFIAKAKANNAKNNQEISEEQWLEVKEKWGEWETEKLNIQDLIMNQELKNKLLNNILDSPLAKIKQATKRLKNHAGKIDDLKYFLSEVDKALKIFGNIIKVIYISDF
ncbi:MAG: hypothetical protein QNJ47_00800 [Nostocaceae cyanobacterium]|nr:hypothetical protein [Nostocaceae cyanobacterium]